MAGTDEWTHGMPDIEPTVLQQRTLVRAVVEQVESSALQPGIERVYSLAEIATPAAARDMTGKLLVLARACP